MLSVNENRDIKAIMIMLIIHRFKINNFYFLLLLFILNHDL